MNSEITSRFIQCYEELCRSGKCRSARQFAQAMGVAPQSLNEILKLRREVNIDLMEKACIVFSMNANFLVTGIGPKFLKEDYSGVPGILTIVIDHDEDERIVHVPVQAQAGYPGRSMDPVFVQQLPSYNLPLPKLQFDQTTRSYEVDGESMEPLLYKGDIVISTYIHPVHWEKGLREGPVYVIVTCQDVLVKRFTNRLVQERKLILHSDNPSFSSIAMALSDIREIWQVKARISTQMDKSKPADQDKFSELGQLKQMLTDQGELLRELMERLNNQV